MPNNQDAVMQSLNSYQQEQETTKTQIMSTRLTPRKAQAEQKKLMFQTLFFFLLTILLILALIFFVIPGLIQFVGGISNISVGGEKDIVAPRVPMYSAPVSATNQSSLTIDGFGEAKSEIILVHNGSNKEAVPVNDEGKFTYTVQLDEGENSVAFYAKDEAENESNVGKTHTIIFDKEAPELTWEAPEDQKTITNLREQTTEVKGKVSEKVKLYLNDSLVFVDSENNFKDTFQLQQGENTLKLRAVDEAGNETTQERKVNYKP